MTAPNDQGGTKRTVIATYDAIVDAYEAHERDNPAMEPHYEKFLSLLPRGARILDAGCGPGQAAQRFAQAGHRVVGFDLSERMVARAKERAPQAEFTVMDIERMELHRTFDGIWAAFVLVHVPRAEHARILAQFARHLVPGGALFLGLIEGVGEQERAEPYDRSRRQFFVCTKQEEIAAALRNAGFKLISYSTKEITEAGEPFLLSFAYAKRMR